MHAVQFKRHLSKRSDNFQIEWLTDTSIPLPKSFEFVESTRFGDLLLINPYVGHNPVQIFNEKDFTSLETTCRFHNIIKPGIVLSTGGDVTKDEIVEEFKRQDPAFVQLDAEDKIRYYSGFAVVGRVLDVELYNQINCSEDLLELNQIKFYE